MYRRAEFFLFDIYVAILKVEWISSRYDPEEVWNVIHKDLPSFKEKIYDLIMKVDVNLRKELISAFIEENKHLDFVVSALRNLE